MAKRRLGCSVAGGFVRQGTFEYLRGSRASRLAVTHSSHSYLFRSCHKNFNLNSYIRYGTQAFKHRLINFHIIHERHSISIYAPTTCPGFSILDPRLEPAYATSIVLDRSSLWAKYMWHHLISNPYAHNQRYYRSMVIQ